MVTLGIDLSSQSKDTAACLIRWSDGRARVEVHHPREGCDDKKLNGLIEKSDVVGIDAPFGWPTRFVAAVAAENWPYTKWSDDRRDRFRFRTTDFRVRYELKRWPLSVSSDKLALPAMRVMALLRWHRVTDRSGGDRRFFEVYPAGSLERWGLPFKSYKKSTAEHQKEREKILSGLLRPGIDVSDNDSKTLLKSDDALDAFVASLTARVAAQEKCIKPANETERSHARREGWIHLPEFNCLPQL